MTIGRTAGLALLVAGGLLALHLLTERLLPMTLLFYDTETTGLPDYHKPSELPHQPHMVQLAALLTDDGGKKLGSLDLLIRPEGWDIPPETIETHGITPERAALGGVTETTALALFLEMVGVAEQRIAHNDPFDARIIRIALKRYGMGDYADRVWKEFPRFCTKSKSSKLCKLPPTEKMLRAGRKHYKSPNLGEAYRHFTGKPLEGGHNAMVDVMAVRTVYLAIRDAEAKAA